MIIMYVHAKVNAKKVFGGKDMVGGNGAMGGDDVVRGGGKRTRVGICKIRFRPSSRGEVN